MVELILGDCREKLKSIKDNSIDSVVTDPPGAISFMGKDWDSDRGGRAEWVNWLTEIMQEVIRVLKPGGHALVWSIPKTTHWTAWALENSGFEIRDCIYHIFGSGFPKSLNISDGWGTGLRPAVENWWLVRKPLGEKTIKENVTVWGTGALNIDACRVGLNPGYKYKVNKNGRTFHGKSYSADKKGKETIESSKGRWPTNVIHDGSDEVLSLFPETKSGFMSSSTKRSQNGGYSGGFSPDRVVKNDTYGDSGSASRFFYCAKASPKERNSGLNGEKNTHPTVKPLELMRYLIILITPPKGIVLDPFMGSGSTGVAAKSLGFDFIGIELNPEYFETARQRINNNREVPLPRPDLFDSL